MRRALFLVALISAMLAPTSVAAQSCDAPTVNAVITAEAAVSRPAVNSPGEIPLSNVYASLSQATNPQFVYAEAGPQFAGVFEALAPPGTPEPPRAVAAYPSLDIPDEDVEDWGGRSETKVTSTSGLAVSTGSQPLALGDLQARSSASWVSSTVECDTITVVAGWEANDVVVAPGSTVEQFSQVVTLVVSPEGSSADVESVVVGAEGFSPVPLEGRPTDPLTDPIADNDGPRIDVGEPRTSADEDGASASGGGFNLLFLDPEAGQGAGYRIGSVVVQVDLLGELADPRPAVVVPGDPTEPTQAQAIPEPQRIPDDAPTPSSVIGTPPEPSPGAIAAVRAATQVVDLSNITVESRNWMPLILFGVSMLFLFQLVAVARIGRRWDPTLDWIVRHGDRVAQRFAAQYLKW